MTTINQIVKAVATIDKSTTSLANDQCKLGQLLNAYKDERCVEIKPKEFYSEIEGAISYKKAMVCQLIQLAKNAEKYGVVLTLSASRYIQTNAKNEQFIEHVEQVTSVKQGELVDKAELEAGFEKPESDKSTEEKLIGALTTSLNICKKGLKVEDITEDRIIELIKEHLLIPVKEAVKGE